MYDLLKIIETLRLKLYKGCKKKERKYNLKII